MMANCLHRGAITSCFTTLQQAAGVEPEKQSKVIFSETVVLFLFLKCEVSELCFHDDRLTHTRSEGNRRFICLESTSSAVDVNTRLEPFNLSCSVQFSCWC